MPLLTPIVESSKNLVDWLFTSDFPTTKSYNFEKRQQLRRALQDPSNNRPTDQPQIHEATTIRFRTQLKIQFLKAFGFDGLNTTTNTITCADGRVEEYTSGRLPLRFVITSLLGMPNRPDNVVNGVPQLSLRQFLLNWVGGFTIRRDRFDKKIQNPLQTAI